MKKTTFKIEKLQNGYIIDRDGEKSVAIRTKEVGDIFAKQVNSDMEQLAVGETAEIVIEGKIGQEDNNDE